MKFERSSEEVKNPLLEKLEENHFASVDEGFSTEDKEFIESFEIINAIDDFDYYGSSEIQLQENLAKHLQKLGNNSDESIKTLQEIVSSATMGMLSSFKAESAWVTLRTSLPNDAYDIPRWHADGSYFTSSNKVYKKVLTIKGAQTLFAEVTNRDEFERLQNELNKNVNNQEIDAENYKEEDLRIRRELVETVNEIKLNESGESVVYLVGDGDAVIHSEPPISDPRIFISVLVGTDDQIEEWKN